MEISSQECLLITFRKWFLQPKLSEIPTCPLTFKDQIDEVIAMYFEKKWFRNIWYKTHGFWFKILHMVFEKVQSSIAAVS